MYWTIKTRLAFATTGSKSAKLDAEHENQWPNDRCDNSFFYEDQVRFLVSFNTPPPHRMIEGGVAKGNRYYFLSVNFLIRLGTGLLLSFRANEKRSYPTFDWRTRFAVMAGRSISLFRMCPKKKPTLPTTLQVSKSNRGHFISHSRSTFLDRVSLDFKCTCFATSGPLRRRFFL